MIFRSPISKSAIVVLILLCCGVQHGFAQKKKNFFDKLNDQVDKIKESVEGNAASARKFQDKMDAISDIETMSSKDFSEKVTLTKGVKGDNCPIPDGITEDQMNRLIYKGGEIKNLTWTPVSFFDKQLFPSAIIGLATYTGKLEGKKKAISQPLGFSINSKYANMQVRWEIECVGKKFFPKLHGCAFYGEANRQMAIMPDIAWNFEALGKNQATIPLSIIYRIIDDKGNKEERTVKVQLRSINDCIYHYTDINLDFLFLAYIQEEHPEIDNILREALNTKMVGSFSKAGEEETNMQVAAIWRVLHDRDFRYSSITTPVSRSDSLESQSVRPFAKAIKTNQGNCIDGTIVMASILKKIGISTVMVLVPGHCFLGYYPVRGGKKIKYVETTLLSNDDFLSAAQTAAQKKAAYKKQFEAAVETATEEYAQYKGQSGTHRLSVDELRKMVKPIPFYVD